MTERELIIIIGLLNILATTIATTVVYDGICKIANMLLTLKRLIDKEK